MLAVDGSDIQIPTNKDDPDSLFQVGEHNKPYNLLHLNVLYDLMTHIYKDALVCKTRIVSENKAFQQMIDSSSLTEDVIVIADRGYESYNNMAHIQEKGWKYIIRIKDFQNYASGILHGLNLKSSESLDEYIDLRLTKKNTAETKQLAKDRNHYRILSSDRPFDYLPTKNKKTDPTHFYHLPFRVVRFPIAKDSYEVVVTNLDKENFPMEMIKQLYAMRWGVKLLSET